MENIFQSRPLFCVSTFFGLFVQDGGMRAAETVVAVGGDPVAGPSSDQVQHVGGGAFPNQQSEPLMTHLPSPPPDLPQAKIPFGGISTSDFGPAVLPGPGWQGVHH